MLITLQQIHDKSFHEGCWAQLLKSLGNPDDFSMQVSFGDIAKSNGAQDALWCLRCIDDRRFGVSLILPALKRALKHTADKRVHDCISLLDRFVAGENVSDEELRAGAEASYSTYAAPCTARTADAAYAAAYVAHGVIFDAFSVLVPVAEYAQIVQDIIEISPLHALKVSGASTITKDDLQLGDVFEYNHCTWEVVVYNGALAAKRISGPIKSQGAWGLQHFVAHPINLVNTSNEIEPSNVRAPDPKSAAILSALSDTDFFGHAARPINAGDEQETPPIQELRQFSFEIPAEVGKAIEYGKLNGLGIAKMICMRQNLEGGGIQAIIDEISYEMNSLLR